MGISIHYRGSIREHGLVKILQEEIIDICETMNWDYRVVDEPTVSGVTFEPHPECETVPLLFDHNGNLVNLLNLIESYESLPWVAVKTQFAGTRR
jgi:hypothetical protein